MAQPNEQLRIIAQPKALYRERYGSEHFKTGNRVQRYIRAEDNQLNFEYPTIEIRREWSDAALPQYIRVASVTVPNDMESIEASRRQQVCAQAVKNIRHWILSLQR
ncbi:unnamed protein product [Adineta steineri]|uniref:Uncharacterized protein n=1 Tax=Adineta steineri TaxID=433720 RepID=A0A813VTU5_9BILA|nr:unnamed protein product [Adineta steineri]